MKKIIKHMKEWNYWRKRSRNSKLHKLLVLLRLRNSPTFEGQKVAREVLKKLNEMEEKDWKLRFEDLKEERK